MTVTVVKYVSLYCKLFTRNFNNNISFSWNKENALQLTLYVFQSIFFFWKIGSILKNP
jgi:hypothetical protein